MLARRKPLQQKSHRSSHPSSKAHLREKPNTSTACSRRGSSFTRCRSLGIASSLRRGRRRSRGSALRDVFCLELPAILFATLRPGISCVAADEGFLAYMVEDGTAVGGDVRRTGTIQAGAVPDQCVLDEGDVSKGFL